MSYITKKNNGEISMTDI